MPAGNPKEKIACPQCNCGHCPVYSTQVYETTFLGVTRKSVRRHRKCRFCGMTFITIETYENPNKIGTALPPGKPVPKDGGGDQIGPKPHGSKIAARRVDIPPTKKKPRPPRNPYL